MNHGVGLIPTIPILFRISSNVSESNNI
jgi:hypothetical protein